MPRFQKLADWLTWQETLHPEKIDLGLERVAVVAARLDVLQPEQTVITVAGTNGKGSSVALLESILTAAGYAVATYTSPHLLRYNERIQINGSLVSDDDLCAAFTAVDAARCSTSLSYFEFGTLAALWLFKQAQLDILVLEVGMGGRLDAVNILDPDISLVTSISIDHSHWLGTDRETIGREKAGIFRQKRPAICSDPQPPASLQAHARELGADWYCLEHEFSWKHEQDGWSWQQGDTRLVALPMPSLPGEHQLDNAAGVLMVLELLKNQYPVDASAVVQGLHSMCLPGRCQITQGPIEHILDVAHNVASAARLAQALEKRPCSGRTRLVLGMLDDKPAGEFAACLAEVVDDWYFAGLAGDRGQSALALQSQVAEAGIECGGRKFPDVTSALQQARADAAAGDRVVICGSFLTVAEALACPV